jgi:REP element-mobilizing transposase RayT
MNSCLHDNGTRYDLRVAVVMPDHVRMIMVPRVDEKEQRMWTMPEILDAVKGASAHLINKALGRRGLVWQQESFDHVLRSSESLDAKIQFVLDNPVRRGLVANSGEYPWLWHREQESPYRPDKLA